MKIIVGMTAWSKHINDCRTTIESMLKQTRRPDAIELNLDLENIGLQPKDLELGYSFRRYWLKDDPSKVRHGDYPYEQFVKEREYMEKRGIV